MPDDVGADETPAAPSIGHCNDTPTQMSEDQLVGSADPRQSNEADAHFVEINEVTKRFGEKTALKQISFSVPSGQICGLLGPNGAGNNDPVGVAGRKHRHVG